jgi:hypothetical protein
VVSISLQIRNLAQLFNSMDPSPFLDRDLDSDAEEFILSWARELSPAHEIELVVHLTESPPPEHAAEAEGAVQHYFASRAEMKQREFRQLMRRGRISLFVGALFLVICLIASELLGALAQSTTSTILRESLTIAGWVAMWRPLEIYLYDWWPVRDERRMLEQLSRMKVRLHPPTELAPLDSHQSHAHVALPTLLISPPAGSRPMASPCERNRPQAEGTPAHVRRASGGLTSAASPHPARGYTARPP